MCLYSIDLPMDRSLVTLPREKLIVYGMGGAFHWFHEIFMIGAGYRPEYLVDRKRGNGEFYEGIPITPDLSYSIPESERHRYTVVVCVGTLDAFNSIEDTLFAQGFLNIVWLHRLYEVHDPFCLSRLDFATEDMPRREQAIADARALFKDELSRAVFDCYIETHRTKAPVPIPQSPADDQYFPQDIGKIISFNQFILCGSGKHDLTRLGEKLPSTIECLLAFEADPYVFKEVSGDFAQSAQMSRLRQMAKNIVLLPCAVSSKTGCHAFASASHSATPRPAPSGFGSRLSQDGSEWVQTIALDEVIHGNKPSYICMDIEGEELEAITGARRIIESGATDLAVSVYHKASHIWEIPLRIHSFNPDYRLHLRNYTGYCVETILYASS